MGDRQPQAGEVASPPPPAQPPTRRRAASSPANVTKRTAGSTGAGQWEGGLHVTPRLVLYVPGARGRGWGGGESSGGAPSPRLRRPNGAGWQGASSGSTALARPGRSAWTTARPRSPPPKRGAALRIRAKGSGRHGQAGRPGPDGTALSFFRGPPHPLYGAARGPALSLRRMAHRRCWVDPSPTVLEPNSILSTHKWAEIQTPLVLLSVNPRAQKGLGGGTRQPQRCRPRMNLPAPARWPLLRRPHSAHHHVPQPPARGSPRRLWPGPRPCGCRHRC